MQCVFCAQDKQTGSIGKADIRPLMERLGKQLSDMPVCAPGESRELAFYGGTFTALPADDRRACLSLLSAMKQSGRITHARCSTRPDAISSSVLNELKEYGVDLIELGIQSFDSSALAESRRGYDRETALAACHQVQEAGFGLGIQLLPGMPGSTPDIFLNDVRMALDIHPSCMRFYPCLVPEGTVLARWFREGRYTPWSMEQTVATLGLALAEAWEANIPVIRLSVAPEPSFDADVLAGPRHPALGALIQAEALLTSVQKAISSLGRTPQELRLPRSCQGYMYGDRGSLKPRWAELGLTPERIFFTDAKQAELRG